MIVDEWYFGGDGRGLKWFLCGNVKPIIRHRLDKAFSGGAQHAKNAENGLSFKQNNKYIMPITSKGFTLIELMVTISVAAILAAVAIPSMGNFINQTRLSGNVNEFIAATMLARSEAIQRSGAVTMCRSTGAETGSSACDTGDGDWNSGWLIYAGNVADTPDASTHKILARQGAFAAGTSIAPVAAAAAITYNANGVPWPAPPASFAFTFKGNFSRTVCFSPSGRTSALPANSTNPCP